MQLGNFDLSHVNIQSGKKRARSLPDYMPRMGWTYSISRIQKALFLELIYSYRCKESAVTHRHECRYFPIKCSLLQSGTSSRCKERKLVNFRRALSVRSDGKYVIVLHRHTQLLRRSMTHIEKALLE